MWSIWLKILWSVDSLPSPFMSWPVWPLSLACHSSPDTLTTWYSWNTPWLFNFRTFPCAVFLSLECSYPSYPLHELLLILYGPGQTVCPLMPSLTFETVSCPDTPCAHDQYSSHHLRLSVFTLCPSRLEVCEGREQPSCGSVPSEPDTWCPHNELSQNVWSLCAPYPFIASFVYWESLPSPSYSSALLKKLSREMINIYGYSFLFLRYRCKEGSLLSLWFKAATQKTRMRRGRCMAEGSMSPE